MTAMLAQDAGYPQRLCIDATAAALVHDIGHLFLPEEMRGVPEPMLDERAKPVFKNHTLAGAQMLLGAGCSPLWVAAAYEHHRGVDGGGYPSLESSQPPHELVRMIALANYYDKKRTILPNGGGDDPVASLAGARELEPRYFGAGLIRRFLRVFGVFPPGTTVELTSMEPAVVTRANGADPWRPQVKILRGPNAGKFVETRDVDPRENRYRLSIVRAITPPLLVLSDVVIAPPVVRPMAVEASVPAYDEAAEEAKRNAKVSAGDGARDAADRARAQLGGMDAMLDALLTVPTHALVSAMPAPPSAAPGRMDSLQVPSYRPVPQVASLPPRSMPVSRPAPSDPRAAESAALERLGRDTTVPVVVAAAAKGSLDPRAGFVLTFVDGTSSIADIVYSSGLPHNDVLYGLADLLTKGVISVR
jgi:hypothetical protein